MDRPPPWPDDPIPELARHARVRPAVVLDDDPTGTQTLRDVSVLTTWDAVAISRHLDDPVVFLSTNSRAVDEAAAVSLTAAAARAARHAASLVGRPITVVSRGDSTLRGHFPAEPLAIAGAMGMPDARVVLAPYFGDAGRVTVDDVHLLERGGSRQPVGETEFARDEAFGYAASNLREWVADKFAAAGRPPPPIGSLPLDLVRRGGPAAVAEAIAALPARGVAIVNAEVDRDIEVVALGAALAEEAGAALVARTAASYVRARAGRAPAPLLDAAELGSRGPGLVVVGSHVPTTTRQLERLLASAATPAVAVHELELDTVLGGGARRRDAIADAAAELDGALASGRTALLATERTQRDIGLHGARAVSAALVDVVRRIERRPAWVVAKGGITSLDVAQDGLKMGEARVAGQILPGVPVWVGGEGSRWPRMPLVVFPGNVGDDDALARIVEVLGG